MGFLFVGCLLLLGFGILLGVLIDQEWRLPRLLS